jgi:hypothetical protein
MSNERFDENIKQKLESVRPAFEESAWKKFQAAVPVPRYATLFQDWGGWIFGGLASAAFLTTLYFSYLQQKTNELLHEEISTIKSIQIPQNKVDTVIIEKYLTDTIYVVKTIRQVVEVPAKDNMQNSSFVAGDNPVQRLTTSRPTQGSGSGSDIIGVNSEQRVVDEQRSEITLNTTTRNNVGVTENQKNTLKGEVNNSGRDVEKTIDKNGNVIREKPELTKEQVEQNDKPPVENLVIPETKTTEGQKKKFKLPYIRTRVGLAGDYLGLRIPSVGPTTEFFFGYSNLSLSTGLLFSSPQVTQHKLLKDFNQATGKRFEEFYKDKFRPQQSQRKIEDITIRTSFIKVPIAFNYYINTRSDFDFIFTAGTRLDVSVFQDIQFESNLLTDRINEKFEARPKPKVFSGLFYGMGLQYQKGRFVGQFTPYFDFRFRQNEYVTIPRTFGINASVKYDLGRGL